MQIPTTKIARFVRDIADQCMASQSQRALRGQLFESYFLTGAENGRDAALYNKTYAFIDDVASLLFSPVGLRFQIADPDFPSVVEVAKGKAAAARLRNRCRQSDTDSQIGEAVLWSLVKGKTFIKMLWSGASFFPVLVEPEAMGVYSENYGKLDQNMGAFTHSYVITTHQFERLIERSPNRDSLRRRVRNYASAATQSGPAQGITRQVVVGEYQPFAPASNNGKVTGRGIVDWMASPTPNLAPEVLASMLQVDEVWIWDDAADDWATFKMVGDLMISDAHAIRNEFAFNPKSGQSIESLKGKHPFRAFCPNPLPKYFWGRSEILNVAMLQEAINSRINGINWLLRKQEQPPTKFSGSSGVTQDVVSKLNKPGGWWSDAAPMAKAENEAPELPATLFGSLHEYERMFDEMGGLPPLAKGHGDANVRSAGHANTLVRMFSARFKDRALLIERSVEEIGALMVDMLKVYDPKRMIAWAPEAEAAEQGEKLAGIAPPFEGAVAVRFTFANLEDDASVTVDSHSSSPAFSQEAKALVFDMVKIGALSPEDAVDHLEVANPEVIEAGIQRRQIAQAHAQEKEAQLRLVGGK